MYYKRRSAVIYRKYDSFGYITDNRNFGYRSETAINGDVGDKIVSQSGALFLSALSRTPQTLEELANKIHQSFLDVDIGIICADAEDFFNQLEIDGFVVSGKTYQECIDKDTGFTYKDLIPDTKNECNYTPQEAKTSTREFFEKYYDGEPCLTNLHMEIISECNERCVHCYIPHENKVNVMPPEMFYNILSQCIEMNVLHLTISGGEPLLHPNFIDFIKQCNAFNFSINILSNLTLLDARMIEEMKRNPLLSVQASLYSMDANIHDSITKSKGSFQKTLNAILELISNNIPVQISCPIMKQNKNSFDEVVSWGKSHNINVGSDYVILARYNHTTQNLCNRLTIDDISEIETRKAAFDTGYVEKIKQEAAVNSERRPEDHICSVCHSSICITENGNVYPCAGWQGYVVGSINDSSLSDIWRNSEKIQYLRKLRRENFPECIHCADKDFCTMCMVRNANEDISGNPLRINKFFCEIAKLTKKIVQESDIH